VFQYPFVLKTGIRLFFTFKLWGQDIKKAFLLWLPAVFGAGIFQINLVISDRIASGLPSGAISSLNYSNRLLEFVLGVFAVSVSTVILPVLSNFSAKKKYEDMKTVILQGFRLIGLVAIPSIVSLYILRLDVIHLLFAIPGGAFDKHSAVLTASVFQYHILGLLFIALVRVIIPVFYSIKDTKTPVKIGIISVLVNCILCYMLSPWFNQSGIALANTIAIFIHFMLFAVCFPKIIKPKIIPILISYAKIVLAAIPLGLYCWITSSYVHRQYCMESKGLEVLSMLVLIMGGILIFIAFAFLFRVSELREIRQLRRARPSSHSRS